MPLLSILIPAYNAALYLARCLDSIVKQYNNCDVEVIIIDDGSSDNTLDIIKEYAVKYNFIKFITRDNKGIGPTRNELIDNAKGQYFWFVDSDDYISEDSFSTLIPILNTELYDLILFSYVWLSGNNSRLVTCENMEYSSGLDMTNKGVFNNSLWCRVYRKSIIKSNNIRFQSYQMGEDFDVIFKIIPYLGKTLCINKPLYHYIANPNSAITNTDKKHVLKSSDDSLLCLKQNFLLIRELNINDQIVLRKPLNGFLMGYLYSIFVVPFPLNYKLNVIRQLKDMGAFPIFPLPLSKNQRIFSKIINVSILRTISIYIDVLLLNIKRIF